MTVTGYATEQQAIMSRLDGAWSQTRVAWPNAEFDPAGAEYVEPVVNRQEAFKTDINAGSARVRHPGLLTLNVRVPVSTGDGRALLLADTLAALFRDVTVDGAIHFKAPTVRDLGAEGAWYRVQVDCPYWRDSIF